jgi:hypothetical protein
MTHDLRQSAVFFDKFAKALADDVNAFVGSIVTSIQYEVVRRTPIDTGRARSNFVVRLNSPFRLTYKAYSPYRSRYRGGSGGTMGEAANLQQAVAQAQGVMARRKPDDTVYITNNLPYIARLNDGYSKLAPRNYVRAGVAAGVASAARSFKFPNISRVL